MRIAFNGKFFGAPATGVQRVAHELITALDAGITAGRFDLGPGPEILCPRNAAALPPLRAFAERRAGVFTWQPWEQFDLPRLARGRLLVNLCNLAPLSAGAHVTMIHDAQVFLTPQSYSKPFVKWYRFALPRIGQSASKVLTVSTYSRDMLEKFGVAPREKIEVIHNGVDHIAAVASDPAILDRLALRGRTFVAAMASPQAHKNLRVICEAFRRPELKGLRLVLIGSAPKGELEAAGIRPPESAILTGRVTDAELRALLEAALAYACPSTTEGFGLPPLEAMYVGCPVVVAPCGALPEVCGKAALYAAPDEPAAWAQAFLELAESADTRIGLVSQSREQASKFRWDRAAARLHEVLREAT